MKRYTSPTVNVVNTLCDKYCEASISSGTIVDNIYESGYTQGSATDVLGDET